MKHIDLHVHSACSDGTFTPARLAAYAAEKGLAAFALTDHDTADGLDEAARAAEAAGVELVRGIEFSTEYREHDIHILGLDINEKQQDFVEHLRAFQKSRENRNEEMAERLRQREGFDIRIEQLHRAYGDAVLTRAHFGRWLFEKGYVRSVSEAFSLYIGDDCPCFVPRRRADPKQAIALIQKAGGIPILAHPLLYGLDVKELETLILELKEAGLQGLEAIYSANTGMDESNMRRLARRMKLKISGGSDFHGKNKPFLDLGSGRGNLKIPYEVLENLRAPTWDFP